MNDLFKQYWPEDKREQRKMLVLMTLGGLALLLWSRAWLLPGPMATAGASEDQPNMLRELSHQIERVYVQLQKREVLLPPPPKSVRDVFSLSPDLVPQIEEPVRVGQVRPKSTPNPVESQEDRARRERKELVHSIQEEASYLRLRSTMVGRTTAAVIEIVRRRQSRPVVLLPGQDIEGFMLLEVSFSSALLEKQGIVIELQVEQLSIQQ
jgi:hypothetical protein